MFVILFIYVFAGILTGSDSPANIPTTFAYLLGGISNGLGSYLDPAQKLQSKHGGISLLC